MTNLEYRSNFKKDIIDFINFKHDSGYKYNSDEFWLRSLDTLILEKFPNETNLTKEIVTEWTTKGDNVQPGTIRRRNIVIREFAKYLLSINKNAYLLPSSYLPKVKKYQSYIYTETEISAILKVIDECKYRTIYPNLYKAYPVFFRILYCCGLRLSEVINLRLKNIDLENGILYIYESKNNNTRYVPITEELSKKCKEYYNQVINLYTANDNYFFFAKDSNKKLTKSQARYHFMSILKSANIQYLGKGKGPRVHDLRHTFAVHSFKQFVLAGDDLNVCMPILQTYMGHTKFDATEYYLKLTADMYPDIRKKLDNTFGEIIPRIEGDSIDK